MDRVDARVLEQGFIAGEAGADAKGVADLVELVAGALANRGHRGVRMLLIDGNEFRAEAQPNEGDTNFLVAHESLPRINPSEKVGRILSGNLAIAP